MSYNLKMDVIIDIDDSDDDETETSVMIQVYRERMDEAEELQLRIESALKLQELVKDETNKPIERGAYGDDKFCEEYLCGERYQKKLFSLIERSEN